MRLPRLQLLFLVVAIFPVLICDCIADLDIGRVYSFKFADINGNTLSTVDGRISIVTVVTKASWSKAQLVGDRVPDIYIEKASCRFITLVKFGNHMAPVRAIFTAGARSRLNAEVKRIQPRYDAKKISRDPRQDIFAVADFDGSTVSQLGIQADTAFHLFVFGRNGELLGQWNDVPSREELAAVLK